MSNSVRPHRRQPTRLPHPWDSPGKNTGVGCHFLLQCVKVRSESEVAQSCPTLSDPMDCSPPGSSIHGIFQARVLEWGAIAYAKTFMKTVKSLCFSLDCNLVQSSPNALKLVITWLPLAKSFTRNTCHQRHDLTSMLRFNSRGQSLHTQLHSVFHMFAAWVHHISGTSFLPQIPLFTIHMFCII